MSDPAPTPRALRWPSAAQGPSVAAAPAAPPFLDVGAFLGGFAPEAATRLGFRLALRPASPPQGFRGRLFRIAACDLPGGTAWLAADAGLVDTLIERLFGAPPASLPAVPVSGGAAPVVAIGGWQSLGRLLAMALGAGLSASGLAGSAGRAPSRADPVETPPAGAAWFIADAGAGPGWLLLAHAARPAESGHGETDAGRAPSDGRTPGEDHAVSPSPWQARVAALARSVELPVGVRIAEFSLPLADVAALGAGALIPIEKPNRLMLSVDGRAWQALPAPDDGARA